MIKNVIRYLLIICGLVIILFIATKFKNRINDEYKQDKSVYTVNSNDAYVESFKFKDDILKVGKEEQPYSELFSDCLYAMMVDDTDNKLIAGKNIHKRMYPASLTKVMTANVVMDMIEEGTINLEDEVTVSKNYDLTYDGVEPCSISYGSVITVKNLLYELLISSNNYYALILADYCAGSEESFCELMNEKAKEIGATNSHYVNPHGLDNPNHYTTAYDIYLTFKEAYTHEIFKKIQRCEDYTYTYINGSGYEVEVTCLPTNLFILNYVSLPSNYEILAWKTGTTDGAGNCLAMYLNKNDKEYKNYFVIAACDESKPVLYDNIIKLLCVEK